MQHSRWDVKPGEQEEDKVSSRRWNNNGSSRMDWNIRSDRDTHPRLSSPPRHRPSLLGDPPLPPLNPSSRLRGTPSPIDYRSESRRQHDTRQIDNISNGTPHGSHQSSMGPPSTHFSGSWPPLLATSNVYPNSNQSHHHPLAQYPARIWGENHHAYYARETGQYIFDMKWWEQQKQSMDAYLGGGSGHCFGNDPKNDHQNSTYPQWSFGTRVIKSLQKRPNNSRSGSRSHLQEGSYNGERQDALFDSDPRRRQSSLEQMDPSGRLASQSHHGHKRDNLQDFNRRNGTEFRDMRKVHPAHHQPVRDNWGNNNSEHLGKGKLSKGGKKNKIKQIPNLKYPSFRGYDVSKYKLIKLNDASSSNSNGKLFRPGGFNSLPLTFQPRLDIPGRNKGKGKNKRHKVDESTTVAEAAKKKALAAAANKLKKTFLAAKKKKFGNSSSAADDDDEDDDDDDDDDTSEMTEDNNAQDLTMPRRHPSCLEFDIDIRFSAKEWASVGRGQGGANNILGRSPSPSSSKKPGSMGDKNSGLSLIDCEDLDDDPGTYSDSDIGRVSQHWPQIITSQSSRRRHLSESSGVMDLRKQSTNSLPLRPGPGRVRSCSLSIVEGRDSQNYSEGNRSTRVKLHLMPKLKRRMLKQLLTMDKKSLQELVDNPRSRKAQYMMTHLMSEHRAALSQRLNQQRFKVTESNPEEELHLLNSLDSSHLGSIPSDVMQQVREILAMEQSGTGSSWEEVSLSVNDLLNADSDHDMDCQIISPPPRDPASTITIHDSDSDMEEEMHHFEHEDEEEEEEVHEQDEEEEEVHEQDEEEEGSHEQDEEEEGSHEQDEEEEPERPQEPESAQTDHSPSPDLENSLSKISNSNSNHKVNEAPIDIIPPGPLDIPPMCVIDAISAGPSGSQELVDQVPEKINMIRPPTPAIVNPSPRLPPHPSVQEIVPPVPGPGSILLTPGGLKVKEERPSPISECGLCMHNPRTPHTSDCIYPYGMAPPSPVTMMSGPPRPLGTNSPQRPVPHMPASAQQPPPAGAISSSPYQRTIKQEKLEDTFMKFEHVKRPSSEERPKNPAPPDTTREELLPLAIPPPAQTLHHPQPHPRPLIFSPDEDFREPPRPPPPPPPQFSPRMIHPNPSPRIKLERHTPVQFMCCCMRNECERSSTHSAEMRPLSRRSLATPQPSERRPTPHLYKMEPPSPCASRARTPHQSLPGVFAPPASPRCVNNIVPLPGTKVTIGVQTDKDDHMLLHGYDSTSNNHKRQYVPNLTLARSVTPLTMNKVDQSTTTDDLVTNGEQQPQRIKPRVKSLWWHKSGRPRNFLNHMSSITNSINEFEFSHNSGVALQQMMVLSEQESEFVRYIENIDLDIQELMKEKKRIAEELGLLQNLRKTKLKQLMRNSGINIVTGGKENSGDARMYTDHHDSSSSEAGDLIESSGNCVDPTVETNDKNEAAKDEGCVQSTTDNSPVVSSSQEKGPRTRSFSFSQTSSNDSSNESQTVGRQRCTSTCHSPGKGVAKTKGTTYQITYLGPVNSNEFYEESISNNKVPNSASNTDSESDTEEKSSKIQSSEAVTYFNKDIRPSTSRNIRRCMSSSSEGEGENEASRENKDRNAQIARLRHMLSNENEAVVDSSQRQSDIKMEIIEDSHYDNSKVTAIFLKEKSINNDPETEPTHNDGNLVIKEELNVKEELIYSLEEENANASDSGIIVKEEIGRSSRKNSASNSPSSSPDSQKCRNSSGEHCYSLRSRGPPTVKKALLNIDNFSEVPEDTSGHRLSLTLEDEKNEKMGEEEHADDEREKDDDDFHIIKDMIKGEDGMTDDKRRKRKRKTKKYRVTKKRKKKKSPERSGSKSPVITASSSRRRRLSSPSSDMSQTFSNVSSSEIQKEGTPEISCDTDTESSSEEQVFVNPPSHGCAILDIKVVGDMVFTASSDCTARCYDLSSGQIVATYNDHEDIVSCLGIVGKPSFTADSPEFVIVTGSADKTICVFNGKTGILKQRRTVGESVRCLAIAWGQVFIGTEGGSGGRWNLKDKKISEMVTYCGKALTSLRAMTEGGRRVLLVAAKTTPLMIRDAMTGLLLRTFEHDQLTAYATVSSGGSLYSGGSSKSIINYDFNTGTSRSQIGCEADVSCLCIFSGHLIATCYDGLIRIFNLKTGELLQRIPVETTNKMLICSALYKDRLLVGNKKGEIIGCTIPQLSRQVTR